MLPYKTEPVLLEKIWGGRRLIGYNKSFSGKIGESIEFDGQKMGIPLVIKLIDAWDNLSIQVHPDKETASELNDGTCGKDELWVVLDCEEGSEIYCNFKDNYDKKTIYDAALDGSIIKLMNKINVKKGDCIFLPSGTVHALGKGVLVYELQQASNITYRLYDWDRVENGKRRELHIDKALRAIKIDNYISAENIINIYDKESMNSRLISIGEYEHFGAKFVTLKNEESIMQRCDEVKIITVISGKGVLCFRGKRMTLKKGDTFVIPADSNECVSIIGSGLLRFIESWPINANL
ncbi:MAG: type I phosphomannose isomerase catalytic subunit [Lutispora sp.]|jgi:mannose-6-phosphate isomerase